MAFHQELEDLDLRGNPRIEQQPTCDIGEGAVTILVIASKLYELIGRNMRRHGFLCNQV